MTYPPSGSAVIARERLMQVVPADREARKARALSFGNSGSSSSGSRRNVVWLGDGVNRGWAGFSGLTGQKINYAAKVGDIWKNNSVFAAISWVRRNFPDAPIAVRDIKTQEIDAMHPMAQLLRRPNPVYSYSTLFAGVSLSYMANGNAYIFKVRDGSGKVVQLWYRPHWMVTPTRLPGSDNFIDHYEYRPDARPKPDIIPVEDVIHLRNGIDPENELLGLSDLKCLLMSVYSDNEVAAFIAAALKNQGIPGLIIKHKPPIIDTETGEMGRLTQPEADKIKAEAEEKFSGDNVMRTMVLDGDFDVSAIKIEIDSAFVERAKDISQSDIASATGISPVVLNFLVGLKHGNSRASHEDARKQSYRECLIPMQRSMAEDFNSQLLRDFDRTGRSETCFDYRNVATLSEDQNALVKRWVIAFTGGVAQRAESRRGMGLSADKSDEIYVADAKAPQDNPQDDQTP